VDEELKKIFEPPKISKGPTPTEKIVNHSIFIKDMQITKGSFTAIIGKVGSGKTTLLHSLMDELVRISGTVRKNGTVAYVCQEPFLINDTIKNNIIFGNKWDKGKYEVTLKICQLTTDLDILPGRDMTQIGERGINLSGG
jgi:ABC-type bacteriocin/lantibiotic exporter with double-glycine peptidase domain